MVHYLLPDFHARRLVDRISGHKTDGVLSNKNTLSIKSLHVENSYHQLLKKFKDIIQSTLHLQKVKHSTVHHIKTSKGSPDIRRPRRLDRFKIAKAEFDLFL